jgi:energy-coupling factor transporter ATP-binding protein EcfA2
MLQLPTFSRLRIEGYGLFPGKIPGKGLSWDFEKGVCLIAGINGLGKTTLITMLLRLFTGPYDLTSDGLPQKLESIIPEFPIILKQRERLFFAQRVADHAKDAVVTLKVSFNKRVVEVGRRLSDLRLLTFILDDEALDLGSNEKDRESAYQSQMCALFDLSSFVDVLLVLHHVVFFKEGRAGALWDENAQRHILRALFFPKELAAQVARGERRVQQLDSNARNISAAAYQLEKRLKQARAESLDSSEKSLELASERVLLQADTKQQERLDSLLVDLDDQRKDARRELEQSKIAREESETEVERIKFAMLERLFPSMEDAVKLVLIKALSTGECLVCGSETRQRLIEVERQLAVGTCPVCGAPSQTNEKVVPAFKLEDARVKKARLIAERALKEEEAKQDAYDKARRSYDLALAELIVLREKIQERESRTKMLASELPLSSEEVRSLEQALGSQRREQRQAESNRAIAAKELASLLEQGKGFIQTNAKKLANSFRRNVKVMISEDADLVQVQGSAKLTQGKEIFSVPAFLPEMTAADRVGKSRRNSPDDVSESQRELIDLAFRLALIELATDGASCTLTMETPEASLDGLAMNRVGQALHKFASSKENRLIVTSNLTNAGMISAMFGGPARKLAEIKIRQDHVINLLEVAAPNRAVLENRSQYRAILKNALVGKP